MDEAHSRLPTDAGQESPAGLLQHLQVEYRPTELLRPARRNARSHSKRQIDQIAASIKRFGFVNPILVDGEGRIIAGHGRLAAARALKLERVPVLQLDHLSEADRRAYALADNRLAELAGWDRDLLAIEIQELSALEIDFDLTITGFEIAELDELRGHHPASEDDRLPAQIATAAVSRPGDRWLAGPHRILCADAAHPTAYVALLDGERAAMVFTDPPYNVPIQGHVSGLGAVQHREFAMAVGEMSAAAFTAFLRTVCTHLVAHSTDGSLHFLCMDWRHLGQLLAAGESVYAEYKNLCVWAKDNGGMGSLYRSRHELIAVFKAGTAPHTNNIELGRYGRYRTNVWEYPGGNSLHAARGEELALHPTVKPVALVADAIKDCSRPGQIILDVFGGSGTTLLAAERTGRRGFLMELDPLYVDVTLERFERATGQAVQLAETGETFAAVAHRRQHEAQHAALTPTDSTALNVATEAADE
ncbi:MAG: site-specific DNA-methyltransferase [Gammaproteobacteria bacterium]|nr:site-specific DNA-methyltransferase [Gammaproteobacteria bacterium]